MSQAAFRLALTDPDSAPPAGLLRPGGGPAGRRFDVYRNNVAVGLKDALAAAFPAVRALVGEEFFNAMAGVFVRAHPPSSPVLSRYGDGFAAFLAGFPPVAHLGYLPDVARLETLLRQSYHAADAAPVAREAWSRMAPDALAGARLAFAPAIRLLRSDWPVLSIWRANRQGAAPPRTRLPEDVLVTRADFDPVPQAVGVGAAPVLEALIAGQPLAAAIDRAGAGFDLSALLALLLGSGAVTAILSGD